MRTPGRTRRLAGLLVAALILVLPGGSATSQQGRAGGLLPTSEQMARVFPHLGGGQRSVSAAGDFTLLLYHCNRDATVAVPRRSERADYTLGDGRDPFEARLYDPTPQVFRFAAARDARTALAGAAAYVRQCRGWTSEPGTDALRLVRLADPGVGSRSVAWRLNTKSVGDSTVTSRSVHVVARRGRTVVMATVSAPYPVDQRLATRLARLTLRASR